MPAKSQKQQQAAALALSAKRGDKKPSELKGAARQMYDSMNEYELKAFAKTKRKNLPAHVDHSEEK